MPAFPTTPIKSLADNNQAEKLHLEAYYFQVSFQAIKNLPELKHLPISDEFIIENKRLFLSYLQQRQLCNDSSPWCGFVNQPHYEFYLNEELVRPKLDYRRISCQKRINWPQLNHDQKMQLIGQNLFLYSDLVINYQVLIKLLNEANDPIDAAWIDQYHVDKYQLYYISDSQIMATKYDEFQHALINLILKQHRDQCVWYSGMKIVDQIKLWWSELQTQVIFDQHISEAKILVISDFYDLGRLHPFYLVRFLRMLLNRIKKQSLTYLLSETSIEQTIKRWRLMSTRFTKQDDSIRTEDLIKKLDQLCSQLLAIINK